MKKFFLIVVLLSSVAVFWSGFFQAETDKNILTLKNGSVLEVDDTWETGDLFFYEIDGEVFLISKSDVKRVAKADYVYYLKKVKAKTGRIADQAVAEIKDITHLTKRSMDARLPLVGLILGATAICILIMVVFRAFVESVKPHRPERSESSPNDKKDDEIGRLDIVRYFLSLFKFQIGAPPDALTEIAPLSSKSSGPNYIYELRVNDRGEWVKRRMTIGPLGEETGSKSKCFYVIYDVHLVVKIPSKPMTDFEYYIESINKEGRIVEKLAPKECVIPKVSVILDLIHKFPDSEHLGPEKLEEKYINWLRRNPDYQNYLKIKNSFIFFMDFSKFYFLGHILDNLHDLKDSIPAEIVENPEPIWEIAKFRGRYGKEKEFVFFEIREVYDKCEAQIRKFLTDAGEASSIPLFRLQSWFLSHLSGQEVSSKDGNLAEKMVSGLNRLIRKILKTNKAAVDSYRNAIREYVYKIRLEQNKPLMAGMITNLLDLLAWLREKQVSMRDLKPDNLLVAGDPSKYPRFLMSAAEYSLGIIDVETAVDFEISRYRKIKQPLLGGTPFYATPSHFFANETLQHCFHNFRKILHYQDWHAMEVMIFKVVTGGLLFEQTAKIFGYVKEKIRYTHSDPEKQAEVVKEVSQVFWRSACAEFQAKMAGKEEALRSIQTIIPDNAKRMFTTLLLKDQKSIIGKIQVLIASQPAFKSDKSRELLLKSSALKIAQFKDHLKNKFKTPQTLPCDPSNVLKFLDDLIQLKTHANRQKLFGGLLNQPEPKASAYDLLSFMFFTVYHTMFKEDWQMNSENEVCIPETLDDEATTLEAEI
jgi:serine/threonine protein kinase